MYLFIKISQFLLRLCPTKFLAHLFQLALRLKGYRKQVINNNYKSTIGNKISEDNFKPFYHKCIRNIARILIETLKFDKSRASNLSFFNVAELEERCQKNNGLILMASHYGNWELACINLPIHTSIPCYGVYKPLKNKPLDKELIKLRSRFGLHLVPMNSIARTIATNASNQIPAIYILIADQNPRSIRSVIWEDFLGIKTAFSNGVEKFHDKYKLAIAYMKITPQPSFYHYNIEFEYPSQKELSNPIQWYSQRLENQIKAKPEYWLWSHKRWKRKYTP